MSGLNKVMLIGNLGKDPEYRHMEGGVMVARFPLATSEYYKNKEGLRVEQTEWHRVVMWRGLAEAAEKINLRKGQMVYIEGKIRSRTWEKDGIKKYETEIVADNMTLLSRRESTNGNSGGGDEHSQNINPEIPPVNSPDGDLPF
ncbi:MAG: single-stranded DNA-binding protein [Bacteroidota bacterium]